MAEPDAGTDEGSGVGLGQVLTVVFAIVGLRIGLEPLGDNSFLTHLATGRLIVADGAIPRTDPYSFTAFGEPWTVQSWGASVIYGLLDRAVGLVGIRVLVAASTTLLALGVWRLTRPAGTAVPRLLIAVPAITVGASVWVERPLLFGLLGLVVTLLVIEDEIRPIWLVPVMWVWVNTHGSFPLGLAAIGAFGLGRLLDRRRPTVEARAFAWAALGTVLGVINPLGPALLRFPFEMLGRREAFSGIVEWQSPTWESLGERAFALQLILAIVLLAWRGRSWRLVLPTLVFGAAALQSSRNIVQASLILLPVMAVAAAELGSIDLDRPSPVLRPVRAALLGLAALVVVVGLLGPDVALDPYPEDAVSWMRDEDLLDLESRVVSRDFVGNYLHARLGPDEVRVYFDDRVDMYPQSMIDDYAELIAPDGDYAAVLGRAEATAVLWDTDSDLERWLEDRDNGWQIAHRDEGWLVALPATG